MNVKKTFLHGLMIIETSTRRDQRGTFTRLFCEHTLASVIGNRRIMQVNHSCTAEVGAVRGMHYQNAPHAEIKLVRCLKGRIWDVAVDLRARSSTFLKWHAEELTPENARMMLIPQGFAHGFQVQEPESELLYLHTELYNPSAEGGLCYNDPLLSIEWPIPVTNLSIRDANHPLIATDYAGIDL